MTEPVKDDKPLADWKKVAALVVALIASFLGGNTTRPLVTEPSTPVPAVTSPKVEVKVDVGDWKSKPTSPVPLGKFAVFQINPDLKEVQWFAVSRSTVVPDPKMLVDSNGVDALVETTTNGFYRVGYFGLKSGKTTMGLADFEVGFTVPVVRPVVTVTTPVDPAVPATPTVPATPATEVTAVTYVYEKDLTVPPLPVQAALDKLNREGRIVATLFEVDNKDGAGEVPEQYKPVVQAADPLPSLVISTTGKVLRTVRDPKTMEQVLEAAK